LEDEIITRPESPGPRAARFREKGQLAMLAVHNMGQLCEPASDEHGLYVDVEDLEKCLE